MMNLNSLKNSSKKSSKTFVPIVGIGTTAPTAKLYVKETDGAATEYQGVFDRYNNAVGSTTLPAGIRLNASRGVASAPAVALSGDELGKLDFGSTDVATANAVPSEGAIIKGIASGTWSTTAHPTDLTFLTAPTTAAVPVERMRISAAGNVGIGTNAPLYPLHIVSTSTSAAGTQRGLAVTQTFAGSGDNSAGASIGATHTPTASATTGYGLISISTANPPTGVNLNSSIGGYFRADTGSDVGTVTNNIGLYVGVPILGTLKPMINYGLYIGNQGAAGVTTSYGLYAAAQSGATNSYAASFMGGNVGIGTTTPSQALDVVGSVRATSFISTSDRNLKKNLQPIGENSQNILQKITGYKFQWKKDGSTEYGVMAQELEVVMPEAVVTDKTTGIKSVKYNALFAPLIESVKSILIQLVNLEVQQKELKQENMFLKDKIIKIENENELIKAYICSQKTNLKFCNK